MTKTCDDTDEAEAAAQSEYVPVEAFMKKYIAQITGLHKKRHITYWFFVWVAQIRANFD